MAGRDTWIRATVWVLAVCLVASPPAGGAIVLPPEPGRQPRLRVEDEEVVTRTLRFSGGDRTLEVRTINGSIRVAPSSDGDVHVDVRRRTRAETDADRLQADRDVTLEIAERSGTVAAVVREADGDTCGGPRVISDTRRLPYTVSFDFAVRVPAATRLRLCTVNGGEISVDQTAGDFTINNVNGRITMGDVRGSGTAQTVNGPVTVSFREAPRAASLFKTLNGDVTATFPHDFSADLALKTFNGDLYADVDVEALPLRTAAAVERRNGRSVYRSDDFTRVRAGRGGPDITFETFNGDVRVLRATR